MIKTINARYVIVLVAGLLFSYSSFAQQIESNANVQEITHPTEENNPDQKEEKVHYDSTASFNIGSQNLLSDFLGGGSGEIDPGPSGPPGGGPPNPDVPLDGGLVFLIVAGCSYGLIKYKKNQLLQSA